MADNDRNKNPQFNRVNEREGINEEFHKEHDANRDEHSKTDDELSLGDSVRTYGEVSGTTFGMQSNTAKFSNIGQKNQARKGEGDSNIEDVNNADRQGGNGGTMYSDYLNKSQNEFISGTGQFDNNEDNAGNNGSNNQNSDSIRPFDAMQGNRESGSGGRSERYEGYDPSGDKRPNE